MKTIFAKLMSFCRYILFWSVCLLLPIAPKRVVVSSYYGKGYGDHPKYMVEALLEARKDLQIIWLLKKGSTVTLPEGVIGCQKNSFKAVYYLATARIWIDNCRKPFILHKRKKQYYIHTWHGFSIKRIEQDVADKLSPGYVRAAIKDSKYMDAAISDSDFMTRIFKESFWYKGEVLQYGAPRNDIIFAQRAGIKERVYDQLSLDPSVKTVLYAPTFRADGSLTAYQVDYLRLKAVCEKRFGGRFVVLVRLHPNVMDKSTNIVFDNVNVVNASFYPDMQELLASVDVVLSDYSSLMFDFALSYKPCFQFAVDIEAYKGDRDFYFVIDQLPFLMATSNDELEANIMRFDEEQYKKSLDEFYASVGMVMDGKASQRCAELVIRKIEER